MYCDLTYYPKTYFPQKVSYLFIVICALACLTTTISAQTNQLKSLRTKLQKIEKENPQFKSSKDYINTLNKLASEYRFVKTDSVYSIAKRAYQLSVNGKFIIGQSKALINIGGYYSDNGLSTKAIKNFKKALQLAKEHNESNLEIRILNNLASEYSYTGNYELALKNFLVGLDLSEEQDNKLMQSIINENIASLYTSQKEFDQALEFYQKVIQINNEIGDEVVIAETLSNLASVYADKGDYDVAMYNINKSISTFEKTEVLEWLAFAYSVKGEIYLKQEKYKWALYWFDQSDLLHDKLEDDRGKIDLLNGKATAYFKLGEDEKATSNAMQAFEISSAIKSLEGQRDCSKTLYALSKKNGCFQDALLYHEIYQELTDSIYKDENNRSLSLLKTKLKHDKDKQLLIAQSEKELAKQRNLIYGSIVILLILLGTSIPLYINQKKLKKLNKDLQVNTKFLKKSQSDLNTINRTKDRLFSIIGHDLRGPIGALQGLLKLLASGDVPQEEFSKFIPKLRSDVDHILFTLNNLLSWGHAQMNGSVRKPKMVNLNRLVEANVNLLSEMANNKSIKIIDHIPKNCLILADENQVDVVIRNLISNAIKFTPDNGLINLEAFEEGKFWKIKVRDTGIGMDKKTSKKLFKDNASVTTYGTNNEKGTGLGLSLCREMVEKNKGTIWVESEPKKGSAFYFTVPKITRKYLKAS